MSTANLQEIGISKWKFVQKVSVDIYNRFLHRPGQPVHPARAACTIGLGHCLIKPSPAVLAVNAQAGHVIN